MVGKTPILRKEKLLDQNHFSGVSYTLSYPLPIPI